MENFIRTYIDVLLVIAAFLFYLILWFIKRMELFKKAGVDANVIFKAVRPIQKYFGIMEKLMTVSIAAIITAHFFMPQHFILAVRMFGDNNYPVKITGFIIVLAGLTVCRIAQVTIGKSWRVGIDENAKPGLVTIGIYGIIRNPTYTGLYILCLGVFIILPTVLLSYWILAFFIMMEFQVRCEEEYLEKQYGDVFIKYAKKTKRYLPFIY